MAAPGKAPSCNLAQAELVKCSPKLGQPVLEFSGIRLMPAGAPMSGGQRRADPRRSR
jgi:hypothetical protein